MTQSDIKIFVVDDDESVCHSLKRLLRSHGFQVKTFSSAKDFLTCTTPDINGYLLLDICMPDMNGFELQKKLKELNYTLPVVFISANAEPGDREHALKSGAAGFLEKPFNEESLLEMINKSS